jgi:hypothetical protein
MSKKYLYLIIAIMAFVTFFSCKKDKNVLSFQQSVKVEGVDYEIHNLIIGFPSKLNVFKTLWLF